MVKRQLSDEQIDTLMRRLVNESAAEETLLSEIAESPTTWWGVQRKINQRKARSVSPWPPVGKALRWLLGGGVVAAAVVLIMSFLVFRPASNYDNYTAAVLPTTNTPMVKPLEPVGIPTEPTGVDTKGSKDKVTAKQVIRRIAAKPLTANKRGQAIQAEVAAPARKKEEIKTEFIALSYARDPESGQIVRVKVPSSMMVSLGVINHVESPSDLVDAEVLVGDDGLTRAIRFIK